MNSATPDMNTRRRPSRSAVRPPSSRKPPKVERVRAEHPLEVALREVQVLLDRRQRDVDDRDVEDDHEERRAQEGERPPALRVGHRARCDGCCATQAPPSRRRGAERGREYGSRVQEYVLSELDSGERLITERVASVRSVVARLLDRRRLARRARREGGRLALHRAPALQGHARLRRAADRGDLRRDGRRAERRHLARAHGRLRARPGPRTSRTRST